MKIVKISAIWCGACLIINKDWKRFKEKYQFEAVELDYDIDEDEVQKYFPGDVLPVFIFFSSSKEVARLVGEVSFEDLEGKYLEVNN